MTRAELEHIIDIEHIIEQDEEALCRFREMILHPGHQKLTGLPGGGSGNGDRIGDAVSRTEELVARIEEERRELDALRAEVYAFCMEIADIHIRGIVVKRVFNLLAWREVADRAGGGNTEDSVRKAYIRWAERNLE